MTASPLLPSSVYAGRRDRVLEQLTAEAGVAIFRSGGEAIRSRDTDYPFRAHSDVVYLTGFEEPQALVVLAPHHEAGPVVMFVRERDRDKEIWNGRRSGVEGATGAFGADTAYTLAELDEQLPKLMTGAQVLYTQLGAEPSFDRRVLSAMAKLRRQRPPKTIEVLRDSRDLIDPHRQIKDAVEIDRLRQACAISARAHEAAMRACKPGMHEYELQALIEYIFKSAGALAPAYSTIVGGGANATILHYTENRDVLVDGEIVLIDAGAEFEYYAGDITRSFPVSGRFTPAQRDVYQAVLEAEEAAIEMCTAGTTWLAIHEATVRRLTQAMVDLKLLSGDIDALIEDESYKRFYMHKTGHWLGIDVHDVGAYYEGEEAKVLRAGMVQTIEPGIYIESGDESIPRELWGVGVRIEDDVLTTETGFEVLTEACPKSIDALEAIVGSGFRLEV